MLVQEEVLLARKTGMGNRNSDYLRQQVSVPPPPPQAPESVSCRLSPSSAQLCSHWPPSSRALTSAPSASSVSRIRWNLPTQELHGHLFRARLLVGQPCGAAAGTGGCRALALLCRALCSGLGFRHGQTALRERHLERPPLPQTFPGIL